MAESENGVTDWKDDLDLEDVNEKVFITITNYIKYERK